MARFHPTVWPGRRSAAIVVCAALTAAIVVVVAVPRDGGHRGAELEAGRAFADSTIELAQVATRPEDLAFGDAVVLGYLERLRLGIGSPFRLAEYALNDPRIDSVARRKLAGAILDRTLSGEAYRIEPASLAGIAALDMADRSQASLHRAQRHLAVIERAIVGARDPRAGELSVRLAYELGSAERTLNVGAINAIAPVAALVRDRATAVGDARSLLRAAHDADVSPIDLVTTWRRQRRFAVERPVTELLSEQLELEAIAAMPALLDSVRAIALSDVDSVPDASTERARRHGSLLTEIAAVRLAAGVQRYSPPQAAIVTTVRHHTPGVLAFPAEAHAHAARREFLGRATNEETLIAERARLAGREGGAAAAARLVVAAAAAMRPYAQEIPWFPGALGPSDDELRRNFGIASVRFDDGVPVPWRPYYRRMLADAIRDLRRVLPALALDGVRIRFRSGGLGGATLAMHEPGSRTIHLPIATSAGALAHEIAHDLDWQVGRQRYGRRGSYATDVVVREERGRLAASLKGLTSAERPQSAGADGARPTDELRPAEVFARTLDWFVSVALAREGRVNAYLSAVQDELLAGHVAILPRNIGGWSAYALADVLEEMTLVHAPLREWLLAQWGPARVRRPFTLAREVIATPVSRRGADGLPWQTWTRALGNSCGVPGRETATARGLLARLAAESRTRGALRGWASRYPDAAAPPWARSVTGVGPWSPDIGEQMVRRLASTLLSRLGAGGATAAALDWGDAVIADDLADLMDEPARQCGASTSAR